MAEITEDDLQRQRDKVNSLRERVPEAIAEREAREAAASREVQMAQLQAEEDRLQREISLNEEAARGVDAGTADLLATVKGEAPAQPEPAAEPATDKSAAKASKE